MSRKASGSVSSSKLPTVEQPEQPEHSDRDPGNPVSNRTGEYIADSTAPDTTNTNG
ncbi:hypothetical protein ACFO1B_03805 [Dactylosporangium siamense]|uniref:Uncharacterized protein n=1 Tax=Dactylosporangium siamense TaxID=685454 RepID=A0A919PGL4_9ACTN|nr:hypothetical protein [Dactylosporangium siamense]GIG42992.1 hypothetical protein Dsi01nite_010330 [Dactylosporangium siamense]